MNITNSLKSYIKEALKEDKAEQDITTSGLEISGLKVKAVIYACQEGMLCGIDIAKEVFKSLGEIKWISNFKDGMHFRKGEEIAVLEGKAKVILGAERAAINILSHLSGIAAFTEKFVNFVACNKIKIYDTRKTTPLMRKLEKYAVRTGGGYNHRMDLLNVLMIKDNHISVFRKKYKKDNYIIQMVDILRKKYPDKEMVLEIHNMGEWIQAVKVKPDVVMFDNWSFEDIRQALKMYKKREFEIEISGNISFKQLDEIMKLGVNRISLGCITHSAAALNFSLEVC